MTAYSNQHLLSGMGRIWSKDRSKSVNVFYVLWTSEVHVGGSRYPVRMPNEFMVKEFDFRGKDKSQKIKEPTWVKREGATLEGINGDSYQLAWGSSVGWRISSLTNSSGE